MGPFSFALFHAFLPVATALPSTLFVASPTGALCRLDPATGALLASVDARVTDLAIDGDGVWTVEPGDEQPGRLARYRTTDAGFALDRSLPFGGLDGRLLYASSAPLVASLDEGATLALASAAGGVGLAWPTPASAHVTLAFGALRVATLDDATVPWRVHHAVVSEDVIALPSTPLPTPHAPCGGRLVVGRRATVLAVVDSTLVELDGAHVVARAPVPPGSCVEDAVALTDGRVAALVGPHATLVLLGASPPVVLSLSAAPLPHAPWLSHRLAHDAARDRLWAALDGELVAIDLGPTPTVLSLAAGCSATAVVVGSGAASSL